MYIRSFKNQEFLLWYSSYYRYNFNYPPPPFSEYTMQLIIITSYIYSQNNHFKVLNIHVFTHLYMKRFNFIFAKKILQNQAYHGYGFAWISLCRHNIRGVFTQLHINQDCLDISRNSAGGGSSGGGWGNWVFPIISWVRKV